jgi:hypothetical protein
MECINHDTPAKSICVNCGKALCTRCMRYTDSGKVCCSTECLASIESMETSFLQLFKKANGSSMASAYGAYTLGTIFLIFAVMINIQGVSLFLGAGGIGMFIMGWLYHKNARGKSSQAHDREKPSP